MSQTNVSRVSSGGTQSPPLDDCHPMGACSIRGGNVGGIPDREQRSEYFDSGPSEQKQGQAQAQAKQVEVEQAASTLESAPRASDGVQK